MALAVLLAAFWDLLGIENKNLIVIGFIGMFSFGIAIAGLILGISEIKYSRTSKTWIGLIGNILITLLLIYTMIEALLMNN